MTTLRIATCQYEPRIGEVDHNRELAVAQLGKAAAAGAHLVVLPELGSSGYVFSSDAEVDATSETANGRFVDAVARVCREHAMHVVAGINERGDGCRYNSAVCIGPDGVMATYRKVQLFHDEQKWFAPGDGLVVVDLPWGRLGMLICFDLWFPEIARGMALAGAEVIAVPTNWVSSFKPTVYDERGFCQGNYVAMATAAQNGVVMACADRVGLERGSQFLGASIIVGADGWPVAGPAGHDNEELLVADIDLASVAAARQRTPTNHLVESRRPAAYNAVVVGSHTGSSR